MAEPVSKGGEKMIPVKVKDVVLDQTLSPVVLLVNQEGTRVLPIWVGAFEARAIALGLQGVLTPRPMTHDLIRTICERFGAAVTKIVVTDVREGTYYAEIFLKQNDEEIVIDSRPSDAIALALRTGAEVYITEKVAAYALNLEDIVPEEQREELKNLLAGNEPEEYKKFLH